MELFLVFGYDTYYPMGGMTDCFATCNTLEEAREAVKYSQHDYTEIVRFFVYEGKIKYETL